MPALTLHGADPMPFAREGLSAVRHFRRPSSRKHLAVPCNPCDFHPTLSTMHVLSRGGRLQLPLRPRRDFITAVVPSALCKALGILQKTEKVPGYLPALEDDQAAGLEERGCAERACVRGSFGQDRGVQVREEGQTREPHELFGQDHEAKSQQGPLFCKPPHTRGPRALAYQPAAFLVQLEPSFRT